MVRGDGWLFQQGEPGAANSAGSGGEARSHDDDALLRVRDLKGPIVEIGDNLPPQEEALDKVRCLMGLEKSDRSERMEQFEAVLLNWSFPLVLALPTKAAGFLPLLVVSRVLALLLVLFVGVACLDGTSGFSIHQLDFPAPSFCTLTNRLWRDKL